MSFRVLLVFKLVEVSRHIALTIRQRHVNSGITIDIDTLQACHKAALAGKSI